MALSGILAGVLPLLGVVVGAGLQLVALSAFEKLGAKVDSDESLTAVTALLREMRRDVAGVAADLDELTLRWVLFGPSRK
ncbi:MAG TPA: hypothetical protein VJU34_02965 [Phenylobacterium sp.]|nr:hypothetical protein [Phenylobacterium sp.]